MYPGMLNSAGEEPFQPENGIINPFSLFSEKADDEILQPPAQGTDDQLKEILEAISMVARTIRRAAEGQAAAQAETAEWKRRYHLEKARNLQLERTGEGETFLQRAIQEQGRGGVLVTVNEILETHHAEEMEKALKELSPAFLEMAVLVLAQGERLDNMDLLMESAHSLVKDGIHELQTARAYQKNIRKWTCYGILLLQLIIVFLLVLLKILNVI